MGAAKQSYKIIVAFFYILTGCGFFFFIPSAKAQNKYTYLSLSTFSAKISIAQNHYGFNGTGIYRPVQRGQQRLFNSFSTPGIYHSLPPLVQNSSVCQDKPLQPLMISPAHYANNLAFFCSQELKIQKATRIPLRFRMGSLEQCNFLEGKPIP